LALSNVLSLRRCFACPSDFCFAAVFFFVSQIEAADLSCAMPLELLQMADRGELQYSLVYI
jgi:hypothetical protein